MKKGAEADDVTQLLPLTLPVRNRNSEQSSAIQTWVRSVKDAAVPDMAGFANNLSSYPLVQLNELLEDDEKLNKMIIDMEEVRFFFL